MNVVILAGGFGSRLWPLSRQLMPKQFLKIFKGKSLFQLTIERNKYDASKFIIVTNDKHFFIARDQIEEIELNKRPDVVFILEDKGRNTASSLAFASQFLVDLDSADGMLVVPSDHVISPLTDYRECIEKGYKCGSEGFLTVFGVKPESPNTGYGYIEVNRDKRDNSLDAFDVELFHEKPDLSTAQKYLSRNGENSVSKFYWNCGIFAFRPDVYLEELEKYAPDVHGKALSVFKDKEIINNNVVRLKNMKSVPFLSVDNAVLEKSKKVKMVEAKFHWNDMGSFDALAELEQEADFKENILQLNGEGNFIHSEKFVATIGMEDTIIVDSSDALLVVKKGLSQKVKELVSILAQKEPKLLKYHSKVYRPWGTYEVLTEGKGYKIKRIVVNPGKRLSLQKHFHRNEHWIVVSGTAEIEIDGNKFLLRPNESTYIKMGQLHRLSNPGKIPVVLIEVQTGEYVEEDDIIRVSDDYFSFSPNNKS